jgi:tRNA(adenine34) deaminase
MIQARIRRLVYGAADPKNGGVSSLYRLLQDDRFNHRIDVTEGVLREFCSDILSGFFKEKRIASKAISE